MLCHFVLTICLVSNGNEFMLCFGSHNRAAYIFNSFTNYCTKINDEENVQYYISKVSYIIKIEKSLQH